MVVTSLFFDSVEMTVWDSDGTEYGKIDDAAHHIPEVCRYLALKLFCEYHEDLGYDYNSHFRVIYRTSPMFLVHDDVYEIKLDSDYICEVCE